MKKKKARVREKRSNICNSILWYVKKNLVPEVDVKSPVLSTLAKMPLSFINTSSFNIIVMLKCSNAEIILKDFLVRSVSLCD